MPRLVCPLTLFLLLLPGAACSDGAPSVAEGPGVWRLVAIDGEPTAAMVTLAFPEPGRLVGQGPCNRYFGRVTGEPPAFRAGQLGATRMACEHLALEGRYFAALARVERIERQGPRLRLTGPGTVLNYATPMN